MNERKKTMVFAAVALALAFIAYFSAPVSKSPDVLFDVGEEFFPEFTDPNAAMSLEVIDFDEESGTAIPFKVEFKDGLWRIPSHLNYPADARDRLAKTAAGVIGISKDDFRTDNVADYEAMGVIDPLDDKVPTLKGRGKRITFKGNNDKILADFIVGHKVEGAEGFRFVRVPGQKRVYAVKMDLDLSTKFSDWIDTDLLQVEKNNINTIVLRDYSIDEATRALRQRDVLTLGKNNGSWTADRLAADQEVDTARVNSLLAALDELAIVEVRKKPAGLSAGLGEMSGSLRISQADALSLQSKGYYLSTDGQLLSNEGELDCETTDGVKYILRFGEFASAVDAEAAEGGEKSAVSAPLTENRYLFITTEFREDLFPEPARPKDLGFADKDKAKWTPEDAEHARLQERHEAWQQQVAKGRKIVADLNRRFADWYYMISAASFDKLNLTRQDLVKQKKKEEAAG
jgi:hypothetical protein